MADAPLAAAREDRADNLGVGGVNATASVDLAPGHRRPACPGIERTRHWLRVMEDARPAPMHGNERAFWETAGHCRSAPFGVRSVGWMVQRDARDHERDGGDLYRAGDLGEDDGPDERCEGWSEGGHRGVRGARQAGE
jgi:hypothetical protein